jgi:hypothetical protein
VTVADIPLVPSLVTGDPDREPNFILHWLNNKEMHFSLQAENILQVNWNIHCSLYLRQGGYFGKLFGSLNAWKIQKHFCQLLGYLVGDEHQQTDCAVLYFSLICIVSWSEMFI